mmetsp:Transcript_7306/g.10747  ORF Transcript_7306/g.10747 Transcript_7306/m.10747 type:complete len:100 (-) Transcript_7306:84-383(-)
MPPKSLVNADPQDLANETVAAARTKTRESLAEELQDQMSQKFLTLQGPNTDEYTCPSCKGTRCHLEIGMKGGWISSEKEEKRDVSCCDCGYCFDGLEIN